MTPLQTLQIQKYFNDLTTKLILSEKLDSNFLNQKKIATQEEINMLKEVNNINNSILFDFDLQTKQEQQANEASMLIQEESRKLQQPQQTNTLS